MATFHFRPAYVEGSGTPLVRHLPVKSAEDIRKGTVLALDTGEMAEHAGGSTVTGIIGVALAATESGAGYNMANEDDTVFVAGRSNTVPYAVATDNQVFVGVLTNGNTTTVTTPAAANLRTYGIIKLTEEVWTVDISDTTDVVVRVIKFDAVNKRVWFKFIPSAILS